MVLDSSNTMDGLLVITETATTFAGTLTTTNNATIGANLHVDGNTVLK